jgi:hypothetical protein
MTACAVFLKLELLMSLTCINCLLQLGYQAIGVIVCFIMQKTYFAENIFQNYLFSWIRFAGLMFEKAPLVKFI